MHLKIHVKSVHEGVKYICEHCDYKATTRSNLKIHIKSVHKGDKKSCEIDIEKDHEGKITSASKLEEDKTAAMDLKNIQHGFADTNANTTDYSCNYYSRWKVF